MLGAVSEGDVRKLIGKVEFLAGVPDAALERLAQAARHARYDEGSALFRRGDAGEGMLLVVDGLVRLHLATEQGRELTLAIVGPGEPIGEIALIDGGPRSADATALTPVRALLLRHSDASALFSTDVTLANALLRTLAARLRRTTDQTEAVGLLALAARVAKVLLQLASMDPSGLVRVSQGHIATLVAASRPKVNGVLAEFRETGLIAPVRAGLRILEPAKLRRIGEGE